MGTPAGCRGARRGRACEDLARCVRAAAGRRVAGVRAARGARPGEVIALVRDAGGLVSLAHPGAPRQGRPITASCRRRARGDRGVPQRSRRSRRVAATWQMADSLRPRRHREAPTSTATRPRRARHGSAASRLPDFARFEARRPSTAVLLAIDGLRKDYGGLRPLRLRRSASRPANGSAVAGFDGPAAELLVNLVTGATLPDEGVVRIVRRAVRRDRRRRRVAGVTRRFGIVSDRAVLLEGSTLAQNLAMPLHARDRSGGAADARDVTVAGGATAGMAVEWLDRAIAGRACLRTGSGRACDREAGRSLSCSCSSTRPPRSRSRRRLPPWRRTSPASARSGNSRRSSSGSDEPFAKAVAPRVLTLNGATGELTEAKSGLREAAVRDPGSRRATFFVMTPQATLGPPLTPDFGSPVMP